MGGMTFEELIRAAAQGPLSEDTLAEINENILGLDRAVGVRYTYVGPDRVEVVFKAGSHNHQPAGIVHGGAYSVVVESTASLAGMIAAGAPVVGMNNDTHFLRSVRKGEVHAVTTPLHLGKRTQVFDVAMRQDGELVARGTLTTMVMRDK